MNRNPKRGHFGPYGGRYVPEMLVPALDELEGAFRHFRRDRDFLRELDGLRKSYAGRPTPLYFAENLTNSAGGAQIYLKLEGLAHTGAHKINNALGQALLAKKMGKTRVIAETGAGQHGLATAAACAKLRLACRIFMGEADIERQYPNVFAMRLHGAEVVPVGEGGRTLKDAVNSALKDWIEHLSDTHYLLGSAVGPHPYPLMVRDFQSVIGREVRAQVLGLAGRLPDVLVACVGGGSNALGLFSPLISHPEIRCIGVEAGGAGDGPGENAARFGPHGRAGIVQGYKSFFLQDPEGQVLPTRSVSAGLDYAGIGPELAHYRDLKRVEFARVTDQEALAALRRLCVEEGILPALESAHAVAQAVKIAPGLSREAIMVVNISGRGDKDLFITAAALARDEWAEFLAKEAVRAQRS